MCESRRRKSGSPLFSVCSSALPTPSLFIHLQMLSGSRGGGHPVVKPGSTKHETGSPATARAEVAAAAAVASVQGKELAKANSRRRTAVTMRSKETKARRACSVLLSLSVLPGDSLFGGFLCEILPLPPFKMEFLKYFHQEIFSTKIVFSKLCKS